MGLFDDIADVATGAKKKEKTHSFRMAQVKQHDAHQSGNQQQKNQADQNLKNVNNYFKAAETGKWKEEGAQTQDQIVQAINDQVIKDQQKVVKDKDEKVVPEKKKEQVKYYDDEKGVVSERDLKFLEKKLGQKAIIRNGRIFFIDETGSTIPYGAMIDKLGGALDVATGFKPEKAFGTTNPRVAASFADMFEKMSPERWEDFISGKGNLDRILEYAGQFDERGEREILDLVTSGDTKGLAGKFKKLGMGLGEETFLDEYNKRANPNQYYEDNPPQTLGDMEDMLRSGITMTRANTQMIQEARDRVSESQGQGGGIGGLGGGGGALLPTDPTTDPTKVPDYVLKQRYMPGFTPDYSGGAEQMQIAGGYWDPITKKWIGGGGPWGTTGQYQFPPQVTTMAQGGIVGTSPLLFKNQGGMVNDNGIKAFKKYGY